MEKMEAIAFKAAKEIFKAEEHNLKHFEKEDPFNDNLISGFICNIGDHRYGALYLYAVNNVPIKNQIIWSTPRMGYPFDRNGIYKWPPAFKINIYEKLDGTNILGYQYRAKDTSFITYKTRLTPVLRESKWGDFLGMWREILERYPEIPGMIYGSGMNISFELYGNRNKHTVIYDCKLEVAMLFGIEGILEPRIVDIEETDRVISAGDVGDVERKVPKAKRYTSIVILGGLKSKWDTDNTSYYKKMEGEAEAQNRVGEYGIEGTEGFIWYLHNYDGVKQLKCKPDSIKDIHFSGSGLGKHSIRTTVINAYEHTSDVTYEVVKDLLMEEFDERLIEAHYSSIRRVMIEVEEEMTFKSKVINTYGELKLDILANKADTMRALSKYFSKKEMKKVYWVLNNCL